MSIELFGVSYNSLDVKVRAYDCGWFIYTLNLILKCNSNSIMQQTFQRNITPSAFNLYPLKLFLSLHYN